MELQDILEAEDLDAFRLFYMFFSRDAHLPDPQTGHSLLDVHREGSQNYSTKIRSKLKELIFDKVFENLAQGFIEFRANELGESAEDEASLQEVYNGCLVLLYRLLFLLHAEARDLLPLDNESYRKMSVTRLREDVRTERARMPRDGFSRVAANYWDRFRTLCNVVARGDKSADVPIYNGGLFEDKQDSFLDRCKLSDYYFVDALYDLTVSTELGSQGRASFYDYSSLSPRHLGDIYEGLLEFYVRIAEVPMAAIREKSRTIWVPADKADPSKAVANKEPDEVYIENSNHERKATGSYFTPPYIVEHIVKDTVGPVLDERLKRAEVLMKSCTTGTTGNQVPGVAAIENELFETLFGIKVLDLAMGSGHFLVQTVDYISNRLVIFLARFPSNPVIARIDEMRRQIVRDVVERQGVKLVESRLTEVSLIKRMVMKRCVYGVDLNPMAVELAKLSLWLDSFTLGAPLSFLDHHLKRGNSLIGLDDIATAIVPGSTAAARFKAALHKAVTLGQIADATAAEVSESRKLYTEMQEELDPFRRRLNYVLAREFVPMKSKNRHVIEASVQSGATDSLSKEAQEDVARAERAFLRYRFFHWRVEFPEVFFDEKGDLDCPGFDVTVGNPPYVRMEGFKDVKAYLAREYATHSDRADFFFYFCERAVTLLRQNGQLGYIVSNTFTRSRAGATLRAYFVGHTDIKSLVEFGDFTPFQDAAVYPIIVVAEKERSRRQPRVPFVLQDGNPELLPLEERFPIAFYVRQKSLTSDVWTFEDEDSLALRDRLLRLHPSLREEFGPARMGIKTGLNEAFVIDGATRRDILRDCPGAEVLIKPYVAGENLDRWHFRRDDSWLIYTPHGVDMAGLGRVLAHLAQYKKLLQARATKQKWYELQQPQEAYSELLGRPKIMYPDMSRYPKFSLDELGMYFSNTAYFISSDSLYLLGLLNSKLLWFVMQGLSNALRGGLWRFRLFSGHIERLPIRRINPSVKADKAQHDKIVKLVRGMLDLQKRLRKARSQSARAPLERRIASADRQISTLVYDLYGLKEDEIRIVEEHAGWFANQGADGSREHTLAASGRSR